MRALLTGATSGIGRAAAGLLCPHVDVLLLHGLEPPAAVERELDALRRRHPRTEIAYLPADYGRLADVAALVEAVGEQVDGLELLVNNAGRPGPPRRAVSADGHELTLQTNYLAPVALTTGLLAALERADEARIVNVASATHLSARLGLDDLELERDYGAVRAYARSKLALVTYTCWLARRLEDGPVEAVSLHPGVIATGLLHAMFGAGGDAVEHGAENVVAAARRARGVNGAYLHERTPAPPNPEALDAAAQDRLMRATAQALAAAGLSAPPAGS